MTVEELVTEMITHSDEEPGIIGVDRAAELISMLDKSLPLPDNLTPHEFQKHWNYVVLFDLPTELWN